VSLPDEGHLSPDDLTLMAIGEPVGAPEDVARAAAHLQACGRCRGELDQLTAVARTARQAARDEALVVPPDSVWAGITAELATDAPRAEDADVVPLRRSTRSSWLGLAAAACIGLVVGGGAVYAATSGQRAPVTVAAPVLAEASLAPLPGSAASGRVEVVQTAAGPQVQVDVAGLAKKDGYYEVWLLDKDGKKLVALGALNGAAKGTFDMPTGISMNDYPVVDVSFEPPDGNPNHSHQSLVRGTLQA
jgi:hypothetical protein